MGYSIVKCETCFFKEHEGRYFPYPNCNGCEVSYCNWKPNSTLEMKLDKLMEGNTYILTGNTIKEILAFLSHIEQTDYVDRISENLLKEMEADYNAN